MFRVRVNKASLALADGPAPRWPIIVEDANTGRRQDAAEVRLLGDVKMVYKPKEPLQDGTRVWVECEIVRVIR